MYNNQLEVREIEYGSAAYQEELLLRDRVLRKPLGMDLFAENLDKERWDMHVGAFCDKKLIGVLILTTIDEGTLKMRQVAVDENFRSMKTGTALVRFSEEYALQNNCKTIVLNARSTAVDFYLKLGYEKISDMFLEINIPHYKMQKKLI